MKKKQKTSNNYRVMRYRSPVIKHRGVLRQFAGSPLSKPLQNPLDTLGQ